MIASRGLTRTTTGGLLLACLFTGCAAGTEEESMTTETSPRHVLTGVRDVTEVAQLTGPDSMNRTDAVEVAGQDLGSMFDADGRTYFVFGDTFGQREPGQTGGGGTEWRSNTMAWTTDGDPTDGIRFDGYLVDNTNWAKELISAKKVDEVEITAIPTYGFEANGDLYLAYMSVRHWGPPGVWDANYAGFARSTDKGKSWHKLDAPRWPGGSRFVQVSVAHVGSDLYFWGVGAGRFGGVQLMKVAEDQVTNQPAYRYFTGTEDGEPRWSSRMADATSIVDSTVGELSVVWNEYTRSWLMSYTDGAQESAVLRQSPSPWGPWGDAVTLVSQAHVPGLYAPYMHTSFTADGGRTIYFTLSKWEPYNVFWYRAELVTEASDEPAP